MWNEQIIIKLPFHINIKTHSEWNSANFGRGKHSKNVFTWLSRAPAEKRDQILLYNFEYIFLMITFKNRCGSFFRNFWDVNFID